MILGVALVCVQIDMPGAQQTQGWQVNDHGELVVSSELGGAVYSHGVFRALPPAPGYGAGDFGALAINNAGVLAGPATPPGTSDELSFYLADGVYTFFRYSDPAYPRTEVRGLNDRNISTISASMDDQFSSAIGVVYNPDGAAPYAPGFTVLHPILDGEEAWYVIPGGINDDGVVVGSAWFGDGAHGFIADPAGDTIVFRVGDQRTRARGINDAGLIVGTYSDASGNYHGFLRDGSGDHDVVCPAIAAAGEQIFLESINDDGLLGGQIVDTAGNLHGMLAFPSVDDALADLAIGARAGRGQSLSSTLRRVEDDLAAGRGACRDLKTFTSQARAQSLPALASEANAIAAALDCP